MKQKKNENIKTMGSYEYEFEKSLDKLKVHAEAYFGQDCYVGNSMHKIYQKNLNKESTLLDVFAKNHPDLHKKFNDL